MAGGAPTDQPVRSPVSPPSCHATQTACCRVPPPRPTWLQRGREPGGSRPYWGPVPLPCPHAAYTPHSRVTLSRSAWSPRQAAARPTRRNVVVRGRQRGREAGGNRPEKRAWLGDRFVYSPLPGLAAIHSRPLWFEYGLLSTARITSALRQRSSRRTFARGLESGQIITPVRLSVSQGGCQGQTTRLGTI